MSILRGEQVRKIYYSAFIIFLLLGITKLLINPNPFIYIPFFGLAVCYLLHGVMTKQKTKNVAKE